MKTRLLIITGIAMFGIMFLSANAQYMENKSLSHFENSFSITESQVRYDMFYDISNASIDNIRLNCDSASFTLYVTSDGDGSLQLDIPNGMLGGIFMILVDGKEWNDVSIDKNVLTVNFLEGTSTIEVLGSYNLGTDTENGVCDVIHDPPYSYILSPLKQIKSGIEPKDVVCKPSLELVIKKSNNQSVCIKGTSVKNLTLRGYIPEYTGVLGDEIPSNEIVIEVPHALPTEPKQSENKLSPEQQCANSYHAMQTKTTQIRQTDFLSVSDYVQELDTLLEIKKDIQRLNCESTAYQWIHLATNTQKISEPPEIVIQRTYDNVITITNNQLVIPGYVVPWKILDYLQQHGIEFTNAPSNNAIQTDEGWRDPTRLCSRLLFTNGTQFYASATFHPDPLKVTGIFVDLERPTDCQKHSPIPIGLK